MCTRAPPEHPLSTHSARRIRISRSIRTISPVYIHTYIYTPNIRNLDSFRLFSPRFYSRVLDRLIELGRHEMLRGNFSNRAPIERGKHATPTTQRKISIPSLPCFSSPFISRWCFYFYSRLFDCRNSIYTCIDTGFEVIFFFILDREPLFDRFIS